MRWAARELGGARQGRTVQGLGGHLWHLENIQGPNISIKLTRLNGIRMSKLNV